MSVAGNYKQILSEIAKSCEQISRPPQSVTLIAVSKVQPVEKIREAYQAGCRNFGENYVQEWVQKSEEFEAKDLIWHLIGPLQSNKVKFVVGQNCLIHTVDRISLATEISKVAVHKGMTQDILIQVKLGDEDSKSGAPASELLNLIPQISLLKGLRILGLMSIPPFFENVEQVRPFFKELRSLREEFANKLQKPHELKFLSMGMSHDFKVAIEEGATHVRVGTRIFGERKA